MYSTHNEGKSVVAERFIRTIKNKRNKYMTSISKNVYIDKLDDIVNEYSNTLNNVSHVDISSFALKSNLANLKTEVDRLDIDKLTPVPNDLAKLSNVVKNDVVKKTEYNKLVNKVDNIDTTGFVKKNQL